MVMFLLRFTGQRTAELILHHTWVQKEQTFSQHDTTHPPTHTRTRTRTRTDTLTQYTIMYSLLQIYLYTNRHHKQEHALLWQNVFFSRGEFRNTWTTRCVHVGILSWRISFMAWLYPMVRVYKEHHCVIDMNKCLLTICHNVIYSDVSQCLLKKSRVSGFLAV